MDETGKLTNTIEALPVLSPVVARITQVLSNPESPVTAVVDALKLDPVINGKVLKLANSAYVGIPRTISSAKNAIVLLGRNKIQTLVLATTVLSSLRASREMPFSLYRFWKHSIMVGMIAESVAKHLKRYNPIDAEDAFSAGMLHDIGKLVLGMWNPLALDACVRESVSASVPFFSVERENVSHTWAGGLLSEHWNFPESLKSSILFHHAPEQAAEFRRIASIVHVSDVMTHILGFSTFEREPLPQTSDSAAHEVHLPPERLRVIADEALKNEKQIESFINFLI